MTQAVPDRLIDGLETALGDRVSRDRSLAEMTTYRVGGAATVFIDVEDSHALDVVAEQISGEDVPVIVVGKGSNLLVADAGFDGVAIRLGASFDRIELPRADADPIVRVGGAASLPIVARRTAAAGLVGFEWAVGVPGSIGGAVRMNAGGHGSDMASCLVRVRVRDLATGHDDVVEVSSLQLGYRRSAVSSRQIVEWAELRLGRGDSNAATATIDEIVRWRRDNQPGGPNAGSVFTNPPGDSAGRLVDEVGAKGARVRTAQISTKHANFIQADPGGSADDVVDLMLDVQERVVSATGIRLSAETRLVGFPPGRIAGLVADDAEGATS